MKERLQETPTWLKRAQENSWEAEILLSGLVLFALIQIPGFIDNLEYKVDIKLNNPTTYLLSLAFIKIAVQVLISGFIIHLVFRGIWVGLVGLSFVFPEGSHISNLKLSRKFSKYLKRLTNPITAILKIEKICSLIFSSAFLLFGYVISLMIVIGIIVALAELTVKWNFASYILVIYLILVIIYFLDFITGSYLKRVKWLSFVYYPIYRLFSFLTLSFLYRNIYYTILSNTKKWKVYVGAFSYIIVFSLISSFISLERNEINTQSYLLNSILAKNRKEPNAYDNLRGEKYIRKASIQSDVIKDDFLRLFLVHKASFDKYLGEEFREKLKEKPNDFRFTNKGFNKLYQVAIDDSVYANIQWSFYANPGTKEPGVTTILDIADLQTGWHHLTISVSNQKLSRQNHNASYISIAREEHDHAYLEEAILPDSTPNDSMFHYAVIPFYRIKQRK